MGLSGSSNGSAADLALANRVLTDKLNRLMAPAHVQTGLTGADAIVTHVEVNDHHGVGVLVRRLFGDHPNIFSVRSRNLYGGRQEFGAMSVCVAHQETSRDHVLWNMLRALHGSTVDRVLCAPYFPDDVLNAIALKELFGVPLCTYLMDDQNVCSDGIPDALIAELLEKSALRLAISPELAHAYERKYQTKMWLMPPVVPHRFIPPYANYGRGADPVIVGNIWGRRWVELLRRTVSGSGVKLRWFNNGEFPWLPCSVKDLESDGIFPQQQSAPDQALISILRDASFVVLPSGTLDDSDDRRAIARLSFPSRIPYILASSHAPILVLGHPDTAAARFVTREGIGMVAPYETSGFLEAVRRISAPEMNRRYREAAFGIAKRYTDLGAAEWIWNSLASGRPADGRYF